MSYVIKETYQSSKNKIASNWFSWRIFCSRVTSFIFLLTLASCMGIELSENTPASDSSSEQTATSTSSTDQSSRNVVTSQNFSGDAVQLESYFKFYFKNDSSSNLNGISVKLLAGTAQTQFAHISANLANLSPVVVNVPSFIVDNTVYVVIESGSGTTIERHQIRDNKITVVRR